MRRNLSRSLIFSLVFFAAVVAGCQDAFVSSGILYQEQNKWGKAEQMFKTAIWRNDQNADAHYQLAFTYSYRVQNEHIENGEIDSARIKTAGAFEHFMKAAELKPDKYRYNPEAIDESVRTPSDTGIRSLYAYLFNSGVRLQNEDPDQAMMYFELAGLADPRGEAGYDAKLLTYKLEYNQSRDDEQAIREILAKTDQLEIDDSWEDSIAKRTDLVGFQATMYRAIGQDAMAGRLYEGLLESDPNNVELIEQVALTRQTQGDYAGAADLFERGLDIAEASPLDYSVERRYGLAISAADAANQGELYERTIELAQRAFGFATSNEQRSAASRLQAASYYELEQYEQVIEAIEPVVLDGGYAPDNVQAWQLYYLSLNRVGRVEEATQARDRYQALRGGR
jgi:Tfp pilus assembly protein PilF